MMCAISVALVIAACRLDADLHARHVQRVFGDAHDRVAIDVVGDRDRVVGVVVLERFVGVDDALQVVRHDAQLVGDADDDLLHATLRHVGGRDRDDEDGRVGGEQRPVAVVDHPALGWDDRLAQPVARRTVGVQLAVDDLQAPELGGQDAEEEEDQEAEEPGRRPRAAAAVGGSLRTLERGVRQWNPILTRARSQMPEPCSATVGL